MRLKLFQKAINRIGQIFKKMASSDYRMLNCTASTTAFDPENEKICGTHYTASEQQSVNPPSIGSSEFSSAYVSPDASAEKAPRWLLDFEKLHLEKPASAFDSFDISNIRVTKPPSDPWDDVSMITNNGDLVESGVRSDSSPDSLSNPPSTSYSMFQDFTYSMLSNPIEENSVWDDLSYQYGSYKLQPEWVSSDFAMNGKTTDITSFEPRLSSTPNGSRDEYAYHHNSAYFLEPILPDNSMQFNQAMEFSTNFVVPKRTNLKRQKAMKPAKKSLADHCVFCKNNGAEPAVYNSHKVMDAKGRCLCPALRQYKCPICNADGDNAHTTKYCPSKKIYTEKDMKARQRSKCKFSLKF